MFRRTIKLLTLVAMVLFVSSNSFAQNQWDEDDILTINDEYLIPAQYCQGISYSTDNGILKIYNSNFDCIKTVSFFPNVPNIRDKHLHVYCLTKGIFTSNNKYEFLVVGDYRIRTEDENGSVSYFDYTIDGIYNEDGDLLYEFNLSVESNTEVDVRREPYIIGNKLVVKCFKYTMDGDYSYTKVFNLYNSINSSTISSVQQQNSSKLYPNPARQSVTLEYNIQGQMQEMQIVDMQGRVVANYLLDPSQKQVKINTSNYKKGVYIYRYGNNSGKLVVE